MVLPHPTLWLALGLAAGFLLALLYFRNRIGPRQLAEGYVPVQRHADLQGRLTVALSDAAAASVQVDAVREAHERVVGELSTARAAALDAAEHRRALEASAAELRAELRQATERVATQEAAFDTLREQSRAEFAQVSNTLLRSSGEALREEHVRTLRELLDPVRTKLHDFQAQVDRKFADDLRDKTALRTQIEQLTALNQGLSAEAAALTAALKGDSKSQGDWGELQLERLLEAAGLSAQIHFDTQSSFTTESGRLQRPDCIVRLPNDRCLVIDSKVSLTAYERFCGSEHPDDADRELRAHVASLRNHVRDLGRKAYHELHQIATPDYVLLFVPLEPAFIAAVRESPSLFTEALRANIVLVSPSTLLATMRTVAYIWRQDDQRANAEQIAEVGRKLYDKFVGFVDDMTAVGEQLDRAQMSYGRAMDKLCRSSKRGTTLVSRAEELRELGVPTSKRLDVGAA